MNEKIIGPIDAKLCTGCGMCADICPAHAIKMCPDTTLGHLRPQIDKNTCVNCMLCEKKCPSITLVNKNKILETYAAWSKDENVHYESSSGGIASCVYEYAISYNGLIVGVFMDGVKIPRFECTKMPEKIDEFKKSKYLQADHNGIYKNVFDELKKGSSAVFIGLPCQCAAMKRIAEGYDEKLVLIDLICHGTPSFNLFKQYLDTIFPEKEITGVKFRDPIRGEVLKVYQANREIYKRSYKEDSFLHAFMCGDLFADSCYNCRYAEPNRIGDLTIGDFWGLGRKIPFNKKVSRVSCVLVNTEKGKELFANISHLLQYEKRPTEEAIDGNSQLHKAPSVGEHRNDIITCYRQGSAGSELVRIYGEFTEKKYKQEVRKEIAKKVGKAFGLKKVRDFLRKQF